MDLSTITYLRSIRSLENYSIFWPNDWALLWVLICMVHLTVCSYHVTYAFHSKSTLYSCLNVKELLVRRFSACFGQRVPWASNCRSIRFNFRNVKTSRVIGIDIISNLENQFIIERVFPVECELNPIVNCYK